MTGKGNSDPHVEIAQILEVRRNQASITAEMRYSEVTSKCADFVEIEDRIRNTGLKYNKMAALGEISVDQASVLIEREIGKLKKEKLTILKAAGYRGDYLDRVHVCNKCKDAGYVEDDKGIRVRCSCYNQMLIERLYQGSNIAAMSNASFETFEPLLFSDEVNIEKTGHGMSPRDNIVGIKDSSLDFVNSLKSGKVENLYFFGPAGTGKTFVCTCIAKRLLDAGFTVLYISAPSLFNALTEYRMKAFSDERYSDEVYRSILDADLLIVDDLGTEAITAARYSEFLTLLNSRYPDVPGVNARSTIISTNNDLKSLRKIYDERVISRIIGGYKIISFFGNDLRLELASRRSV